MRWSRLSLIFLIASTALARVQGPTYPLVWHPKEDQNFTYTLSIDTEGQGTKISFGGELGVKVVKIEPNGDYTIETIYQKPTITVDGQTQSLGDDASVAKPETQKYNAKGDRIDEGAKKDEGEGDPFGHVLGDVMEFNSPENPVKIGDKWTKVIPGDEKKKTRSVKLEYTAASLEKIGALDTVKVTYTYAETEGDKPAKAEGAYYIDAADGSLVKVEATVENLKFEDGTVVSSKVKLERK